MSSVTVLAPNGRRQTVKCTPNTTILQILEEVCKKQGFKSDDYDIKHFNKILDTTTTIRFSGLPNNAQLELCDVVKRRLESEITLAVNLENGSRLIGNFLPTTTLYDVLKQLCPDCLTPDKSPVVIYTRREIYGSDLENTTLKALGLTGGRAMIRVIHKSPEELKVQANVSAPLPSKPVEEKPYRSRNLQRTESPPRVTKPESPKTSPSRYNYDEKPEAKVRKYDTKPNADLLKLAKERNKSSDISKSLPKPAKKVVKDKTPECECKDSEPMEVDCDQRCSKKCANHSESKIEEDFVFLGSRNAMLFSWETANAVPSEELPDDFFDLTIEDAKKILRDVKRTRNNLENAPLRTAALRNLEESKQQLRQLNKYKKAIIRIQFPDRTVLQGTFAPSDTVESVLDFIREFIEDKSLDFYVYFTPPKTIINKEHRLLEIGCVPGALLYFGTNEEHKQEQYLKKELRNKFTTSSVASMAASRIRTENTRNCSAMDQDDDDDFEENVASPVNVGASTSTGISHENYERKVVKTTENVPKWFKPSK